MVGDDAGRGSEGTPFTAAIIYESMFGSSRRVAEAIAAGMEGTVAPLGPVDGAAQLLQGDVDLLVVGAPTHAHSLSRPATREQAVQWAADPKLDLELEPRATGDGVREWLATLSRVPRFVAAFDTRADIPEVFSGAAGRKIQRELRKLGGAAVAEHTSYLVDNRSHLQEGQLELARAWGTELASRVREQLAAADAR